MPARKRAQLGKPQKPSQEREESKSAVPMTKKELQKFEKLLLAERDRILQGIASLRGEVLYQPLSDRATADPNAAADIGTDSFDRETALRVVGTEATQLYEIDQALERIKNGTYGICEGTGKLIPKKRLEAFPAARYCVEYQAELEKAGRDEAPPDRSGVWILGS